MWKYEDLKNENIIQIIFDNIKNDDSLIEIDNEKVPYLTDEFIEEEINRCKIGLNKTYKFYK